MATAAELQAIDWTKYIVDFLDANTFTDSKAAAVAIGAHARAEFGRCNTMTLEILAGCEFNRRVAAESKRQAGEWLVDFQSAGVR